jgi:hypothetical protein
MTDADLRTLTDGDLVARFRICALNEASALLDSDIPRVTELFWDMRAINDELKRRGPQARRVLLTLLDDKNLRVRLEAARRLLTDDAEKALQTIKDVVASHQMPEAGDAGMLLLELERDIGQPT